MAYKLSWRGNVSADFHKERKKEPKKKESLLKLPQAVEIDKGGPFGLLLDNFHKLLEKVSAQNAPAFSHLLCSAEHKNWYVQRDVMYSGVAEAAQDRVFLRAQRT